MSTDTPESTRKAQIDALLLQLPGVSARKIHGLDSYYVSDRMFACISGAGIGLRLPAATATELRFSRNNVVPFQPAGMASSREWIQIDCAEVAEYEKDLQLFRDSRVRESRRHPLGRRRRKGAFELRILFRPVL